MRKELTASFAIILLAWVAQACSLLPKRPLTHHITLQVDTTALDRAAVASQTVKVIERRLDLIGVSNSEVKLEGDPTVGRIVVSLPDLRDFDRTMKIITAWGQLDLAAVVSPPGPAPVQTYSTKEAAEVSLGGKVPDNRRVLQYAERSETAADNQSAAQTGRPKRWVVVEWPAIIDGQELRNATPSQDPSGSADYQIAFSLRPSGAEKFGAWTGANINRYLAVVLNDEVKSIPYIKSQIFDQGMISGKFTKQSAEDLAFLLRAGALPAPVKIVSEAVDK